MPSSLYTSASVNLIDGPNMASSTDGTPVTSSARGVGSATASASDFQLTAAASGGGALVNQAAATAQGFWAFQIQGVPPGTPVPLSFSYRTALALDVATPLPFTFPPPRIAAVGLADYDVSAGLVEQRGLLQIASQDAQVVVNNVVGDVGSDHVLTTTFTGGGLLIANVFADGTQDPRAISSVASAGFELVGVTSPLSSQYPGLTLQFDDGRRISTNPDASLKDNGPATDTPGNVQCGEPIDIGTGNVYQTNVDYSTAGSNALGFTRYYNTYAPANDAATTLGGRWRSTYDRYLHVNSPTSLTAERATGQVLSFSLVGGVWRGDSDMDYQLTHSGSSWTLVDPQDNAETYTDNGSGLAVFAAVRARDGYTQTLQYDGSNRLAKVVDSFGRALTFAYRDGLLDSLTTPDGLELSYGYGSSGARPGVLDELTSVTYPTAPPTRMTYDYYAGGLLKDVIDQDGNRFLSYAYDGQGRATQVYMGGNPGTGSVAVSYNDRDGSRTVTDANNLRTVYHFATLQGVPKVVEIDRLPSSGPPTASRYTYDADGYVASYTDWNGNVTRYANDVHGQPVTVTEAADTPLARTTIISYLPNYRLPARIVAPGRTTDFTYDAGGNLLALQETDTTAQTVPYSTNGQQHTWTYSYDAYGHVLTSDGPRTDVADRSTYTYDASGNLTTVTDALGHVTKITAYDQRGLPLSLTDPNGVVTRLAYDPMGRLVSRAVVTAAGDAVTRFGYDAAGLLTSVTRPDQSVLDYSYDAAQRLVGVSDPAGERITYTLDGMGNVVRQDITDARGVIVETQSQVFDELNELVRSVGALPSEVTRYAHDANGNDTSVTDPANNTTAQAFDALNRLVAMTDPLNGVTRYGYDAQGDRDSVTTPRNFRTSYVYNGFGQLIQATSPETGTTVYRLDPAGNVVSQTDARGVVTRRTFDALNRLTSETYPASPGENVTYTYDSTRRGNKGIGRLTGFTDETGRTELRYDELGDLAARTQIVEGRRYTTAYAHDLAGNVTRITYPSGRIVHYSYDSQGRISDVTTQSDRRSKPVTLATDVSYEPFGPLASFTYGNGMVMTRSFDADYRISGITTRSASTTVQEVGLSYDPTGNITSILDNLDPSRNQAFSYDALNRLTGASGAYSAVSYNYDADSNRLSSTQGGVTQTYVYSATSDRLLSLTDSGGGAQHFTYTADGNIASKRGDGKSVTYSYSARDRLQRADIRGGDTARYLYDAWGERLTEQADKTVTDFTYDQNGRLIAETNGKSGNTNREYVWLGDLPLAQIGNNGKVYYVHLDQTNTPLRMTNAAQRVVWDREQQPFGETVSTAGKVANDLRFPGQIADAASGLNYNMMRDYDPALGRYIEADPIGVATRTNLYGYVGQNPLKATDQLGLCTGTNPASISNLDRAIKGFLQGLQTFAAGAVQGAEIVGLLALVIPTEGGALPIIGSQFGKLGTVVGNPGIRITAFSGHGLDQVITRGIVPRTILSAMNDPLLVFQQAGNRFLYLSNEAVVIVSQQGTVISAYGRVQFQEGILSILKTLGF